MFWTYIPSFHHGIPFPFDDDDDDDDDDRFAK